MTIMNTTRTGGSICRAIGISILCCTSCLAAETASSTRARPAKRLPSLSVQKSLEVARKRRSPFKKPTRPENPERIDLRLTTADFADPAGPEVGAPAAFRLLSYNGLPCGPTIRIARGTKLRIHLKNDLEKAADPPAGDQSKFPPTDVAEQPHDLCRTNLHTHGLHISPADPGDNVYLCLDPGDSHDFEFEIPDNHPAGTFWYHPHNHGSVAYQLSNGLAGALIVEGSRDDDIADLEDIRQIAEAQEQIFVFQLYNLRVQADAKQVPLPGKIAWIDADSIYNVRIGWVRCDAIKIDPDDQNPATTAAFQVTAINGVINPTLTVRPGEVQRWRFIHAAWDVDRRLTIVDDHDMPTDDFKFHEIALDGLATGKIETKREVEMAPGQRSDVLIQAPLLPGGVRERIYHLKQSDVSDAAAPHGTAQDRLYLARIVVTGNEHPMDLPDAADVAKCRPLPDIPEKDVKHRRTFEFSASDGSSGPPPSPPHYTIIGKSFMTQPAIELAVGSTEEWTIKANGQNHPFHIHVNPFQIVEHIDSAGKRTPMNVWRDTLYVKDKEAYKIRTHFVDFDGRSVLHCHILDHEDQGMMMPLNFTKPGKPLPKQKLCAHVKAAAALQVTWAPAPPLVLPVAGGSVFDLANCRGRKALVVFFQGSGCSHCTAQLRGLVRDLGGATALDTQIVAISPENIATTAEALRDLTGVGSNRFQLLADEDNSAARAFGCYTNGTRKHGLFIVDQVGTIRGSFIGDAPFDDTVAVADYVRQLDENTSPGAPTSKD